MRVDLGELIINYVKIISFYDPSPLFWRIDLGVDFVVFSFHFVREEFDI